MDAFYWAPFCNSFYDYFLFTQTNIWMKRGLCRRKCCVVLIIIILINNNRIVHAFILDTSNEYSFQCSADSNEREIDNANILAAVCVCVCLCDWDRCVVIRMGRQRHVFSNIRIFLFIYIFCFSFHFGFVSLLSWHSGVDSSNYEWNWIFERSTQIRSVWCAMCMYF